MAPPVKGFKLNANGVPDFNALPLRKDDPPFSAWGLYGPKDGLGCLNRLTDERVVAAAREEIKTGKRISMNWPLDALGKTGFFKRGAFHQEIKQFSSMCVNDDIWTFNSQVSSQWDGFRHFAYQDIQRFYNGATQEDIYGLDEETGKKNTVLGIHDWTDQGIVGRGVLIDYHGWRTSPEGQAQSKMQNYDPFVADSIPLQDLQACLKAQGTEPKFGDILFIRTGFMKFLENTSEDELIALKNRETTQFAGIERSEGMLRWIWDHFAAVAGDQPSFESWPPAEIGITLHEVLLAGWGCPIGEFFDLEKLAEHCRSEGRWTFFVTSEPCNVPGGIASPPNVLAIF
ncbi:hypothetical protein GGS21DRAFT_116778 [Xylaria nigripes]|nr:hypothetical protein GGS21DRAFT_116778 [Xylaria nigripes]